MIPAVVQVLQQALEANDEPAAKSIFEFFDTISLSVRPTPHSLEMCGDRGLTTSPPAGMPHHHSAHHEPDRVPAAVGR
jgi:hypothetical protein